MLAEGLARAAQQVGGEASGLGIYTLKGNTPRSHDHRVAWQMMLDASTSDTGSDIAGLTLATPASLGLPEETDAYSAEGAAAMLAAGARWEQAQLKKIQKIGATRKRRAKKK